MLAAPASRGTGAGLQLETPELPESRATYRTHAPRAHVHGRRAKQQLNLHWPISTYISTILSPRLHNFQKQEHKAAPRLVHPRGGAELSRRVRGPRGRGEAAWRLLE